MQVTLDQARRWAILFPRHPACWLAVAALVAAVLVRRPSPQSLSADDGLQTTNSGADQKTETNRPAQYGWLSRKSRAAYSPLNERIAPPAGFERVQASDGSFANWLRHLPCMPAGARPLDGKGKPAGTADDAGIAAVIDLSPTNRNLLNAANMLIRLRAEYLWSAERMDEAVFSFTSGAECPWRRFAAGERPEVDGRAVQWKKRKSADKPPEPRVVFSGYMETLLPYTSSISLEHDTAPASGELEIGDMFLVVGRPGHAIMVLDAVTSGTGARRFLLGAGATPPVSFHVLAAVGGNAWHTLDGVTPLRVPHWSAPIPWKHWRRWK